MSNRLLIIKLAPSDWLINSIGNYFVLAPEYQLDTLRHVRTMLLITSQQ